MNLGEVVAIVGSRACALPRRLEMECGGDGIEIAAVAFGCCRCRLVVMSE